MFLIHILQAISPEDYLKHSLYTKNIIWMWFYESNGRVKKFINESDGEV